MISYELEHKDTVETSNSTTAKCLQAQTQFSFMSA